MKRKTYLSGITAIASMLVCGLLLFTACPGTSNDGGETPVTPKVVSVSIILNGEPVTGEISRAKGVTVNFDVDVVVKGGASDDVTWTLTGQSSGTTLINGVLTIAATEVDNAQLVVKATSTADPSKSATVIVKVLSATEPVVNSVTVAAAGNATSVVKGGTLQFTATVIVSNGAAQTVIWSITGDHDTNTTIVADTSNGLVAVLTVAAVEAQTSITVMAASNVEGFTDVADTKTVTITGGSTPPAEPFDGIVFSEGTLYTDFAVYAYEQGARAEVKTDIPASEGYNGHTSAIFFETIGLYGGGIALPLNEATLRLSDFNALSFWVKSPEGITADNFSFGMDAFEGEAYTVAYKGEAGNGITVGTTWEQIVIPIPTAKDVYVNGTFLVWIPETETNKTLYIDEIKYIKTAVTLDSIVLKTPDDISSSTNTPITTLVKGMKAVYTVAGKTVSLFNEGVKFANYYTITYNATGNASVVGANVVPSAEGTYTFSVSFGGKSAQIEGTVAGSFLVIENCLGSGVISEGGDPTGANAALGYTGISWYSGFDDGEKYGKPHIAFMASKWGGEAAWEMADVGRTLPSGGTWDLTGYNTITFDLLIQDSTDVQVQFILKKGAVEYKSPVLSRSELETWEKKTIPFNTFTPAIPAGTSVTSWQMLVTDRPPWTGWVHFAEIRAIQQ